MFDVQLSLLVIGLSLDFRGGTWRPFYALLEGLVLFSGLVEIDLLIQERLSGHIHGTVATSKTIQRARK